MLALANKLSITTQPVYKFVNKYSIDFDGVDDRIITDGADTVAQNSTYSFWCKSSTTASNKGVFGHGNNFTGAFHFNYSSNKPLLYIGGSNYVFWNDTSAQDDGEWHHWVVYVDYDDINNSKLYVDSVLQTTSLVVQGAVEPFTQSLTIGSDRQVGGNSFEGKIDEFAVYDRELTQAEITRMYNNGNPINLNLNASDYQSANPLITSTKSMEFDGSDDYLNISDPTTTDLDFTDGIISCSAWVYLTSNSYGTVLNKGGGYYWYIGTAPTGVSQRVFLGNSGQKNSTTALTINKWHHIAFTSDNSNIKFYLDGKLDGTVSASYTISANTDDLRLGRSGSGEYLEGNLTEVGMYNRTLTDLEVASLYNQGMPTDLLVNRNNYQSGNPTVFNTKQVDFDGTDDYMVANSTLGSFTGSFSCWVNRDSNSGYQFIVDFRNNSGVGWFYFDNNSDTIDSSSGTLYVDGVASTTLPTDGNWHHAVVTGMTIDITEKIVFATIKDNSAWFFSGKMSQVGLWNSTLTADEVSSLYNHGLPIDLTTNQAAYASSSNLVGYWRMGSGTLDSYPLIADQTNATLSADLIQNGNFATDLSNWQTSSWWVWNTLGAYHPPTNLHKPLYQETFVVGKTYIITFDLNVVQGGAKFSIGTNTGSTTQVIASNLQSGSYSYTVTALQTNIIFNRNNAGSNNEYYVNNVTVKQVNGNPAMMINLGGGADFSDGIKNGSPYANLVQNGDFATGDFTSWVNNTSGNASIVNNQCVFTNASSGNNIQQTPPIVIGKTYISTFDIISITQGAFKIYADSGGGKSDVGKYSFTWTATDTNWYVRAAGTTSGVIDNVTLEEVNTGLQGYWKMGDGTNDAYPTIYDQTSNTNNAVMTNMVEGNITNQYPLTKIRNYYRMGDGILDGYPIIQDQTSPNLAHIPTTNLFIYSEDFSQSEWIKSGVTLLSGQTSPIGDTSAFKLTFSADNDYIQDHITGLDTSKKYTLSFYAKVDSGTTDIDCGNIDAGVTEIRTITDEWVRYEITQTPNESGRYPRPIQARSASVIYLWGCQFEEQSQATAYLKSDGIAAVRKSSTTNLVDYSEDFSQGNWSSYLFGGGNLVTTYGYESPNGLYNATKFEVTLGTGGILLTDNATVSATENYTLSVWMRGEVGGEKVKIDFKNNGSNGPSGEIFTLTTDWIRYEVTRTNDGGTDRGFQFRVTTSQISSDQTFYVYGAQLEQQTQAETYAKTTGLPVTIDLFTENNYGTMTNQSSSDIVEDTP